MNMPNPNEDAPYKKVMKDHDGTPMYGIRTIDGLEEIVNLKTGNSNMLYHKPELLLNPDGCTHVFKVLHMGRREAECSNCHLTSTFIPGVTTKGDQILFHNNYFPLTP